jgi:hypothetical protein
VSTPLVTALSRMNVTLILIFLKAHFSAVQAFLRLCFPRYLPFLRVFLLKYFTCKFVFVYVNRKEITRACYVRAITEDNIRPRVPLNNVLNVWKRNYKVLIAATYVAVSKHEFVCRLNYYNLPFNIYQNLNMFCSKSTRSTIKTRK